MVFKTCPKCSKIMKVISNKDGVYYLCDKCNETIIGENDKAISIKVKK